MSDKAERLRKSLGELVVIGGDFEIPREPKSDAVTALEYLVDGMMKQELPEGAPIPAWIRVRPDHNPSVRTEG
jgi:hypothetical protein